MTEEGASASESGGPICEEQSDSIEGKAVEKAALEAPVEESKEGEASVSETQNVRIENNSVAKVHTVKPQDVAEGAGDVSTDKVPGAYNEQVDGKKCATDDHTVEGEDHVVKRKAGKAHVVDKGASLMPAEISRDDSDDNSDGDFGKILQTSQWSLTHRIKVCKVLEHPTEHWRMTPLSRNKYAKQSLALTNSTTQSDVTSLFPSLQWSDEDWKPKMEVLEEELERLIYQDWEQLTITLEAKLESLREIEKDKELYTAFNGKDFEPWDIYNAVEEGQLDAFVGMMREIGVEHWGLSPGEHMRATPLHWAALHGQLEMVSFMEVEMSKWKQRATKLELNASNDTTNLELVVKARDEFGFTPLHMAIFPSLWPTFIPGLSKEDVNKLGAQMAETCSQMIDILFNMGIINCANSNDDMNFLIFIVAINSESREYFVAKHYLSSPIYPIQLAIWIAHPLFIKKLMGKLEEEAFVVTSHGDTILHLAAWGSNDQYTTVMTLLLRYLHLCPDALNYLNKDNQTPLHIAVFQGKYECVAALLRCHYIKVNIKNNKGYTPLEIATRLLEGPYTPEEQARRVFAWGLGRDDVDGKIFGISTFNYNDDLACRFRLGEDFQQLNYIRFRSISHSRWMFEEIFDSDALRHRQILQISQWSLKHRILAVQMIDENQSELEKFNDIYEEQCFNLAETIYHTRDGMEQLPLVNLLRGMVDTQSSKQADILRGIYNAIEEEDLDEFKRLMELQELKHWSMSLKEYRGATPLHWAALHSRHKMVSFIRTKIEPSSQNLMDMDVPNSIESEERKIWSRIVNARDEFGFPPLHLAVFSHSAWRTDEVYHTGEGGRNAKNCAELIEELYQMGVPHYANNSSQLNFIAWNSSDFIYADDYFSNTELYPIHLGVWFAHPRVVQKLLKRWPQDAFVKTSKGDTTFHCATWNGNMQRGRSIFEASI